MEPWHKRPGNACVRLLCCRKDPEVCLGWCPLTSAFSGMKPSYYTFQSNILGAQMQESESILVALIKSPPSYQPYRNCSGSNEAIADRRDEQQAQVQSVVRKTHRIGAEMFIFPRRKGLFLYNHGHSHICHHCLPTAAGFLKLDISWMYVNLQSIQGISIWSNISFIISMIGCNQTKLNTENHRLSTRLAAI